MPGFRHGLSSSMSMSTSNAVRRPPKSARSSMPSASPCTRHHLIQYPHQPASESAACTHLRLLVVEMRRADRNMLLAARKPAADVAIRRRW